MRKYRLLRERVAAARWNPAPELYPRPDWGQGFCVFNDAAVAARAMQAEGRVQRVLIVDWAAL